MFTELMRVESGMMLVSKIMPFGRVSASPPGFWVVSPEKLLFMLPVELLIRDDDVVDTAVPAGLLS
jgi:hypothetical protein